PDSVGQLTNLEKLYINHCSLKELPEIIGQLKSLTEFFISYCKLGKLPNSIGELIILLSLSLFIVILETCQIVLHS
ncbi:leucine-rich repeat domain-containing protein, partial [Psychrobacter piscatorii]|uniref:leucine-rich repeat domain-containing protein n=1 Tax=Psychrobacter piscatorii TaxID=554343 RepID=UPI001919FF09